MQRPVLSQEKTKDDKCSAVTCPFLFGASARGNQLSQAILQRQTRATTRCWPGNFSNDSKRDQEKKRIRYTTNYCKRTLNVKTPEIKRKKERRKRRDNNEASKRTRGRDQNSSAVVATAALNCQCRKAMPPAQQNAHTTIHQSFLLNRRC